MEDGSLTPLLQKVGGKIISILMILIPILAIL
jgi:hypothetical protein